MKQPDVEFLDVVYDITLLKEEDIEFLNIQENDRYNVVDQMEILFTDTYKLIDKNILKFEDIEDIIFDAKSSLSYISNMITKDQMKKVHIKLVAKLTEIEKEAVEYEYFETAQNFNNYLALFILMFGEQIEFV